jgi:hypothetical protein
MTTHGPNSGQRSFRCPPDYGPDAHAEWGGGFTRV